MRQLTPKSVKSRHYFNEDQWHFKQRSTILKQLIFNKTCQRTVRKRAKIELKWLARTGQCKLQDRIFSPSQSENYVTGALRHRIVWKLEWSPHTSDHLNVIQGKQTKTIDPIQEIFISDHLERFKGNGTLMSDEHSNTHSINWIKKDEIIRWIKNYFYFQTPKELYKFYVERIYELLLSFGGKETWTLHLETKPSSQIPTAQGHTGNNSQIQE